jgi:hypothetical protein
MNIFFYKTTSIYHRLTWLIFFVSLPNWVFADESRIVNTNAQTCLSLNFTCATNEIPFFNTQGCGCRPIPADANCSIVESSSEHTNESISPTIEPDRIEP